MNAMLRFFLSADGPAAVEYAVMLALIIMFAIGSITSLGTTNGGFWGNIDASARAAYDAAAAANR